MKIRMAGMLSILLLPVVFAAHGLPPQLIGDVETKFRLQIGQKQFKLTCPIVSDKGSLMIQWFKNGEQLDWDSRYKVAKDGRELRMKGVKLDDSGRYKCQATNGFGHKSMEFIVYVYDPMNNDSSEKNHMLLANSSSSPIWLIDMHEEWASPIQVNTGGKVELRCPAKGNPLPNIKWYHNKKLVSIDFDNNLATLVIDPAEESHSGRYQCIVENILGQIDFSFDVAVKDFFDQTTTEMPYLQGNNVEPIIETPYNISVIAGHTAQFQCKAKSIQSTLIKWLKEIPNPEEIKRKDPNATIVNANGMHLLVLEQIQSESIVPAESHNVYLNRLTIPFVKKEHAGRYICVVTSAQGQIVYKAAELRVIPAYNFNISMTSDSFLMVAIPSASIFIFFVIAAIVWLKRNQQAPSKTDVTKPPPPPRLPLPAAPGSSDWSGSTLRNTSDQYIENVKPLLLNNSMFQKQKFHTVDRRVLHRTGRGMEEGVNMYDSSSPQPYWTQPKNGSSIYNGGYRTLEVNYNQRHYPSACTEDYSDQEQPFFYRR